MGSRATIDRHRPPSMCCPLVRVLRVGGGFQCQTPKIITIPPAVNPSHRPPPVVNDSLTTVKVNMRRSNIVLQPPMPGAL